ncbi:MAG: hypothetical protein ACOX71_01630 [Lachnospiraceae bacterium]
MLKRRISVILASVLALSLAVPAFADTQSDISAVRDQKSKTEAELNDANTKISEYETKKTELENYLDELNTQLTDLDSQLTDINGKIESKEVEIEVTKGALERARLDVENQYSDMKDRIRYMYEYGQEGVFLTLLESKSISEMLNKAAQFREIASYDREKLGDFCDAQALVEEKEASLRKEMDTLTGLKKESEEKQQEVQALAKETDEKIAEYTSYISEKELLSSQLQQKINQQKSQLAALEAKAEAERKAAEEKAAREAELAAIAAAKEKAEKESKENKENSESKGSGTESQQTSNSSGGSGSSGQEGSSENNDTADSSSDSGPASGGTFLGNFKLTAYCNCAKCCGRANHPTASGVMPTEGRTVAMGGVPFGTKLLINGNVYTVEDRGTPYGHVDIFMNSHSACLVFGLRYAPVYQL